MNATFRYYTPAQLEPTRKSFDVRARSVRKWVGNLPLANPGETIRQVFYALVEVNRLVVAVNDRMAFMEAILEPALAVTDTLAKTHVGKGNTATGKGLEVAKLLRELQAELAHGNKIILNAVLAGETKPKPAALARLVAATLGHLSQVLLRSYQVYLPYPERVWRDIHELYRFAEEIGLAQLSPQPLAELAERAREIDTLYRSTLLIALASPYRLRPGECDVLVGCLRRWEAAGRVLRPADPAAAEALFCVDLTSDAPPTYQALHAGRSGDHLRLLDARPALERLKAETMQLAGVTSPGTTATSHGLSLELSKRLAQAWGTLPQRTFKRLTSQRRVEVVVGLEPLHVINQTATAKPSEPKRSLSETMTIEPAGQRAASQDSRHGDNWGFVYNRSEAAEFSETLIRSSSEPQKPQPHPCDTLDESPAGASLRTVAGTPPNFRVGELIGLREASGNAHWAIGVVRWMQVIGGSQIEFGVQLFGQQPKAVMARQDGQNLRTATRIRTLLLPAGAAVNQSASILMPTRPFRTGDQVILQTSGRELKVRLTKLIESSATFQQYQFSDADT